MNGDVGFFDGMDGELVGIVWGLLVLFSVILFVFREYYAKKRVEEEQQKAKEEKPLGKS